MSFPDLEFEVRPVALTPDQVREYDLPISRLSPDEKRGPAWRAATGVEQTEIDALAALRPDLLRSIVDDAMRPYFDAGLARRVGDIQREWETQAQQALTEAIGEERPATLQSETEAKLDELRTAVDALNEARQLDPIELPDVPDVPEGEAGDPDGAPLIDSEWGFAEASQRLIRYKAYEDLQ